MGGVVGVKHEWEEEISGKRGREGGRDEREERTRVRVDEETSGGGDK